MMKDIIFRSEEIILGMTNHIYPKAFVRPSTVFVKNQNKKDLIVVEIGTDRGYNARSILEILDIKKMYLIDIYPWSNKPEDGWGLSFARCGSSEAYKIAKNKLKKFKNKIQFIKKLSDEAVDDVPDDIDFLYIDAVHDYEHVSKELKLYWPKIKKEGVIGGHDFIGTFYGVAEAVIEFANKNNLKLYGDDKDWWFVKK